MQLFKAFLKIAWKHLPAISIYFVIYAIITFLLGTTSQNNLEANFQAKSLSLCILDEDHSAVSQALYDYLGSLHKLEELPNDPETLQDHLYYRDIDYVLTIPAGFEEKVIQGSTKDLVSGVSVPGSSAGRFVEQQAGQYIQALQIYMAGGYTPKAAILETQTALEKEVPVENLLFHEDDAVTKKEVFYFYRYLPYIFIVLLVCGLAPILVTFNKKDIRERISCSALSLTGRNLQLGLGCVCYSLLLFTGFMALAFFAYGKQIFTLNSLYGMLNSFLFLLIAAALTLFISLFAPNYSILNMISNILGLGMSFLCGVFVEQSLLSPTVLRFSRFLPAYWYTRVNDMLGGLSFANPFDPVFYWKALGIQLLYALAIFAATLAASRLRKQKSK